METISSLQNTRVKRIVSLQQKSSERRSTGLFVVEGQREIENCLSMGYRLESLFYCSELLRDNHYIDTFKGVSTYAVTADVYAKISYRSTTEGLLAVVHSKPLSLHDLQLKENALIVVLEHVEKPGNLGAVLRSADAAGVDAVIVCDPLTDLYNPNLIRSSIGAIFTVPCVACTSAECIEFLRQHNVQILTAQLQDSELYYDYNMRCATAIVMGTESTGLTEQWRQAATAHIRIPMNGKLDSLNVSVSAAILMFEAVRQRSGE